MSSVVAVASQKPPSVDDRQTAQHQVDSFDDFGLTSGTSISVSVSVPGHGCLQTKRTHSLLSILSDTDGLATSNPKRKRPNVERNQTGSCSSARSTNTVESTATSSNEGSPKDSASSPKSNGPLWSATSEGGYQVSAINCTDSDQGGQDVAVAVCASASTNAAPEPTVDTRASKKDTKPPLRKKHLGRAYKDEKHIGRTYKDDPDPDPELEPDDEEGKRMQFLERNRVAACKSRQKKKEWIAGLEQSADDLARQNTNMHREIEVLHEQVAGLRAALMTHAGCACHQIHALKSISDMEHVAPQPSTSWVPPAVPREILPVSVPTTSVPPGPLNVISTNVLPVPAMHAVSSLPQVDLMVHPSEPEPEPEPSTMALSPAHYLHRFTEDGDYFSHVGSENGNTLSTPELASQLGF